MNRNELETRIGLLEESKTQAIANANAIAGAIQECKYWLAQLEPIHAVEPGHAEVEGR